jgi:hypothetical protein
MNSTLSRWISARSGQAEFNEGVLRKDKNCCLFCNETVKDIDSPSLGATFEKFHIGTLANGITLCKMCHDQFDNHFVGVNPNTMRVEVSRALLNSKFPEVRIKWNKIDNKKIRKKSTMVLWPSVAAFREKYKVFVEKRTNRRAKKSLNHFFCNICGQGTLSKGGMKQHKSSKACLRHKAEERKIKNQFSNAKRTANSVVEDDEEDYDDDYA